MRPNLFTIPNPASGTLSTMPRPRGGDWLDDEMAALRAAGVDMLVCLLTRSEQDDLDLRDEREAAGRAGLGFRHLPIVDLGVPEPERVVSLVAELVARLTAGGHVVVHCRAGIGRSSLIAAMVLVRLGMDVEVAWEVIAAARGVPVPETDEQRRWVRRYGPQPGDS